MLLGIIILFGTWISSSLSQFSNVDQLLGDIWGNKDMSSTAKPLTNDDIFEGIWSEDPNEPTDVVGNNITNSNDGECECVPYYLCDNKLTKSKMDRNSDGEGIIDIRITKQVECPHYLLKCCDDEDLTDFEEDMETTTATTITSTERQPKGCGYRNFNPSDTSTGGASQFGEFPWVVAIYYSNPPDDLIYVCGGTLIHPEVVVTVAHCLKDLKKQPKVRAGEWDSRSAHEKYPHQDIDVASVALHAQFSSNSFQNDIALLFLKEPVNLEPHINVACLPPSDFVVDRRRCFSSGFGEEFFGKGVVMSKLGLPLVPKRQCEQDLRKTSLGKYFSLHHSFVCAGGEAGKDTCQGDGGNPLVCPIDGQKERYYLVGIVSWGVGCGGHRIPGVYVNVPHFRRWIVEKLERKNIDLSVYQINYN